MAKSIIEQWPRLTEQLGRGFDGWLASIVDCLKTKRRHLGLVDRSRSAAISKKRVAVGCSLSSTTAGATRDEKSLLQKGP